MCGNESYVIDWDLRYHPVSRQIIVMDNDIPAKLSILSDDPLFRFETFTTSLDAFNHEAYAKAIFKVVTETNPPLSIGLFGPWGIGKSTVINILFQLIGDTDTLKPINFNAWKYSGDSFRRQFLIEVAKQIYEEHPERDQKVQRLQQLNYTEVLREEENKGLLAQVKQVLSLQLRFKEAGLARLLLASVVLFVGGVLAILDRTVYPLLASIIPAVMLFLLKLKFEDVFLVKENPVYDPKLIFPEQFEAEFRKLLDPAGPLGNRKAVIAIDDIDRCEPDTVRDILISIKTFLGQESCFFVVPCDEKSIVQVFQDASQRKGYDSELLRKYFNVGVRMAPLMGTDLVDLANNISRRTHFPASVVQVAVLANYRDARKMKHFLNSFAVKHAIAKARHQQGFMPVDVDKNLAGFAKAVLIEDLYPEVFAKLVEHPEVYEALENAALKGAGDDELKRFGLEGVDKYEGLRQILEKTRTTKIEHIEVFLSLKTTNPEARIPRGWELKNAIVQGDTETVNEISGAIQTEEAKGDLASLLIDLLKTNTDTFLTNTISVTLRLYSIETAFTQSDRPEIAQWVSYELLYGGDQQALTQPVATALQCAKDAGANHLEVLSKRYESEIGALGQPPDDFVDVVEELYAFSSNPSSLSSVLNTQFGNWIGAPKALSILTKLRVPASLKDDEVVPSLAVLEKVAGGLAAEAGDAIIAANRLRRDILLRNWREQVAPIVAERLLSILQPSVADYSPRSEFVIDFIVQQPACLVEAEYSAKLWTLVQQLFGKVSNEEQKLAVHRAVLVFALRSPDPTVVQSAKTFATQNWQTFTGEDLRATLEFLERSEGSGNTELSQSLVQQELATATSEIQKPTQRTRERIALCYGKRTLLSDSAVESVLLKALSTEDSAFTEWSPVITEYSGKLGETFSDDVAQRCLSEATSSHTPARIQAFFDLFVSVLTNVAAESRSSLLQGVFAHCNHSDPSVRDAASSILGRVRTLVNEHDFKLRLNSLVRDLCDKAPKDIPSYRHVLDSALAHSVLLDEYAWRDLGALSKRLMQDSDASLQNYGLLLVSKMPMLPNEHEEDLVHLLISIAGTSGTAEKESATRILEGLLTSGLNDKPRSAVEQFLNASQTDEG